MMVMFPQYLIDMLNDLISSYNKNAQSWKDGYCTGIFRNIANYCGNVNAYQQYKKDMYEYIGEGINNRYSYSEKRSYPFPHIDKITKNALRNIRSKL